MNCETCQRRLLATEDPATPATEVQAHLADCSACQRWQRQLLRIERHVPLVPVPASRAKNRFLNKFLILEAPEPATVSPPPTVPPPAVPWWRRPLAVRFVRAAAIVISSGLLCGYLLVRRGPTPDTPVAVAPEADQDLVARLVDCDVNLAAANTARKRVETLTDVADALVREAHALRRANGGEVELREVAQLHAKVIREGIVAHANTVPAAERRQVLGRIASRLARSEREARQVAGRNAPASAPLLQIAEAARDGDRQLRELIEVVQ